MPKPETSRELSDHAERFWRAVEKSAGCWRWNGRITTRGYGHFSVGGRKLLTHRVAYALAVAPIPAGLLVCHRCDNPPCCNPEHLFLGTHADNMRDMVAKGRHGMGRRQWGGARAGSGNPFSKLTEQAALAIRARAATEAAQAIAADYGVSPSTVRDVINRTSWSHI